MDEPKLPIYLNHKHPLYKLGQVIIPIAVGGFAGFMYVIMNMLVS